MRYIEWSELQKQKVEWWLPGARGGGKEAELFNGYRVSVLQDEKAVETAEQRGECILLRRTAHMKMVKVEVLLVQFYHKK